MSLRDQKAEIPRTNRLQPWLRRCTDRVSLNAIRIALDGSRSVGLAVPA